MPNHLRKKNLPPEQFWNWLKAQAAVAVADTAQDKTKAAPSTECWNWTKRINRDGYGQVCYRGKTRLVHRIAYELFNNILLNSNELLLHSCDNRKCYNPAHLKIGSNSENMLQSYARKPYQQRERKETIKYSHINLIDSTLIKEIKSRCKFDNDCWLYPTNRGELYGIITINKKIYRVHRLMLALKLNKNYNDIEISRHRCPNKACCNPDHLQEGSNSDNMLDSRDQNSILKEQNVIEILNFCLSEEATKMKATDIDKKFATQFNVTIRTIQSVRNGYTWNDIYKKLVSKENEHKLSKQYLNETQVREILLFCLSAEGVSMRGQDIDKKFATKFGCSASNISILRHGYSFKNVYNEVIKTPENKIKMKKDHFKFIKQGDD